MSKTNKYWYPYEEVGCYYRLIDGVLFFSPMLADGSRDTEDGEVDFAFIALESGDFEKDGKKLTFVEYVRAIEYELRCKE